ncbi:nuclease-related domain-containing protein [Hutsoniella sourekii]
MENLTLQFLEILARRNLLDEAKQRKYQWLKQGFEGELELVSLLEEFRLGQYQLIHDLALDYRGKFQIDFLLIFDSVIYLLEVKNYFGRFDYLPGGECQLRGQALDEDIISGLTRRAYKLGQLLQDGKLDRFTVVPVLIFINPYCQLGEMPDAQGALEILARCQIPTWIHELQQAGHRRVASNDYEKILALIDHFQDSTPYLPQSIRDLPFDSMQAGLFCPNCRCLLENIGKIYTHCTRCGQRHHKGMLLDMACADLALLAYDDPKILTRSRVKALVGPGVSDNYIYQHLTSHYQAHGCNRYRYYSFPPGTSPVHSFSVEDLDLIRKY